MKQLIVNADDFGLAPGVTAGILAAHQRGIVTSTSTLINAAGVAEAIQQAASLAPALGIGVHLTLTYSSPLLPARQVPSLSGADGAFHKLPILRCMLDRISMDEVRAEWRAQAEAFMAAGRAPDHLDSHHHISYLSPALFEVMAQLAAEYRLPVRRPPLAEMNADQQEEYEQTIARCTLRAPAQCITSFYGEDATLENLRALIASLPDGVSELMCHPGYTDDALTAISSYSRPRAHELDVLTNPAARSALADAGVTLANFSVFND